jgi:hypothetical protein
MVNKSFFRTRDDSKKKKGPKQPTPDDSIRLAKEQALREKVLEAQRIAAVEKVKVNNFPLFSFIFFVLLFLSSVYL